MTRPPGSHPAAGESTPPPPPPPVPDYELVRKIGQGGYGEVWLGRGITGAWRAVKIVWRDRFADAAPFEREFRGVSESMNISTETGQLALLHVGRNEAAGFFYYVMELADDAERGREIDPARYVPLTFKERRIRQGRMPAARCLAHALELARALAALHARGLLHRDIKPSNVILVNGVAKLADIGLVASAADAHTFVGTEGFVPPEGPGTAGADVYALGHVLYELATGLDRTEFPQMPADFGTAAERKAFFELNRILLRACDASSDRRHRDGATLLADLVALQTGGPARGIRFLRRNLRPAALAALGLIGVVIVLQRPWRSGPRATEAALATPAGPVEALPTEARQLVARVWEALHDKPEPFRTELEVAGEYCRRAAELDSTDAEVWAAWAQVESWYVAQNVDRSPARRESARAKAARALQLAPDSFEARLASACTLVRAEGFNQVTPFFAEAEQTLQKLLTERPDEPRALLALGHLFYGSRRIDEALPVFDRLAQDTAWAATAYNAKGWALHEVRRRAEAMEAIDRSIAARPFFGNLSLRIALAQNWLGDLEMARRDLERVPPADLREDVGVLLALAVHWWGRDPRSMLAILRTVPRDWLQSNGFTGPKDHWVGLAHAMDGNREAAERAWRAGLRLVEQRLVDEPNSPLLHFRKGEAHALLGEAAASRDAFGIAQKLGGGGGPASVIMLGDVEQALPGLKNMTWARLRYWPFYDPLRGDPRFEVLLAEAANDPKRAPPNRKPAVLREPGR